MNLDYFGTIKSTAFIDDAGVYLNGEKIAVSNSERNGYIRYGGELSFSVKGFCDGIYDVTTPLVFIGAVPNCTEDDVYCEILKGVGCDDFISTVTFDKQAIAESENIEIEDLSKFDGVTLVKVEYITDQTIIYSPTCDNDVC